MSIQSSNYPQCEREQIIIIIDVDDGTWGWRGSFHLYVIHPTFVYGCVLNRDWNLSGEFSYKNPINGYG